jgi:tetratricopeptide (TPR) repeat protein
VPFYEHAIELDPDFASAYLRLGIVYSNLGQPARANAHVTKAFELRDHASEREKLHIASSYYLFVTGEQERAVQTFTLWVQAYPRDWLPRLNIGNAYAKLGRYERAVEATRESLKLYPEDVTAYENLGGYYLALNRFPEARDASNQALARKLDEEVLHTNLYGLAFALDDSAGMAQQVAWFAGKTGHLCHGGGHGGLFREAEQSARAVATGFRHDHHHRAVSEHRHQLGEKAAPYSWSAS